ncbi:hypothetical protein [uncultured Gammaproteobacteria bacterium]|jgi:hypothetical protein|nr:hypothetical protein [uncultured Gammaproteobacteria bacterium]CAC9962090.1 hypothetical protein [uncultured Gammaproteobacteria bacterium]
MNDNNDNELNRINVSNFSAVHYERSSNRIDLLMALNLSELKLALVS